MIFICYFQQGFRSSIVVSIDKNIVYFAYFIEFFKSWSNINEESDFTPPTLAYHYTLQQ